MSAPFKSSFLLEKWTLREECRRPRGPGVNQLHSLLSVAEARTRMEVLAQVVTRSPLKPDVPGSSSQSA